MYAHTNCGFTSENRREHCHSLLCESIWTSRWVLQNIEPVTICDQFVFVLMFYVFCHLLTLYKVVDAILLFFCKDTTFPRNFQGFRENVGMVIKKLALCIQHNTAQKASPPLFWIIDLVQDVIILSNKVTVALQPATYILNGCCD